jgi:hypothetical protein
MLCRQLANYAECRYAESRYAECLYVESGGAHLTYNLTKQLQCLHSLKPCLDAVKLFTIVDYGRSKKS